MKAQQLKDSSKNTSQRQIENNNLTQDELIALQNEQLKQGSIKFLQSLQPQADGRTFGIKNKPRDQDPSMGSILQWGYKDQWGYNAPTMNDYIKNTKEKELIYKIRKMDKECISEMNDNYRRPEFFQEKGVYLFNFLTTDNQEQWKKKLYEMAVEGEAEEFKLSTYKQLFCGDQEKQWWDKVFSSVTPAGKPCYKAAEYRGKPLVTPTEYIKQRIEEKIKQLIEKDGEFARQFLYAQHKEQEHLETLSNQMLSDRTMSNGPQNRARLELEERKKEEQSRKEMEQQKRDEAIKKKRAQSAKQLKNIQHKIHEMKHVSRWLPDSAITTYFGKPAFHPYGNGNTKPTVGGTVYGQYMKTHNVNPQSGDNHPEFRQVFGSAIIAAATHDSKITLQAKSKSPIKKQPIVRQPILPRKLLQDEAKNIEQGEQIKQDQINRNPIMPQYFLDDNDENKNLQVVKINKPNFHAKERPVDLEASVTHESPKVNRRQSNASVLKPPQPKNLANLPKDQHPPAGKATGQPSRSPSPQPDQRNKKSSTDFKNSAANLKGFKSASQLEQLKEQNLKLQAFQASPIKGQVPNKIVVQSSDPTSKLMSHQQSVENVENNQPQVIQPPSQAVQILTNPNQVIPFCPLHNQTNQPVPEYLHQLDPKNYKFLPSQFTEKIRPAGRFTHKSESIANLLQRD